MGKNDERDGDQEFHRYLSVGFSSAHNISMRMFLNCTPDPK
jgi:hypothetical protein